MPDRELDTAIQLFSTCPPSSDVPREQYSARVSDVARWSEAAGCEGILVYTDNSLLDPWTVCRTIFDATERLSPLVAVQPLYAHPYFVAKTIASLGYLHGRGVHLNMVAGGFTRDLAALCDGTPHDDRYWRLIEYTTIIKRLLTSRFPVTFAGRYYRVEGLKLTPPLDEQLAPRLFLSGSSEAGMTAATALGATAVTYPRSAAAEAEAREGEQRKPEGYDDEIPIGIRVGVIARDTDAEAWQTAHARFPGDRRGELLHRLAMKVSDSSWHQQLSDSSDDDGTYWLFPFQNYKTFCPYLVGSHSRVAAQLSRYQSLGARTFILDVPRGEDDLVHTKRAFELATQVSAA